MSLWRKLKLKRNSLRNRKTYSSKRLDTDYSEFEVLKASGNSVNEAVRAAQLSGKDWTYQIRMARAVYGVDLVEARQIVFFDEERN